MTDREILRALAGEVGEISQLPIQGENRKLHRAVNNLGMIRPVVMLDELPWNQLNTDGELTLRCGDAYLRTVENGLRRTIYRWRHCPGDLVIDPYYRLAREVSIGSLGVSVQEETLAIDAGNHIISHFYKDQLPDMESLEKLHDPEVTVDDNLTAARRALLDGLFGDLLPVKVMGVTTAGSYVPWDDLTRLRGVEPIYIDLYDRPELLHALMRKVLGIRLRLLDRLEAMDLLDPDLGILHCTPGLVDGLPGEIKDGHVTRGNLWGRGAAQMFASVSPAMHDEFEIEYAKVFFEGFGMVYYGCCEPLHDKIDIVKKLPNLRKISITPWADVRKASERIGKEYVLSWKPNPSAVSVAALDEDALRRDILETLTVCREHGTAVDITLKDISSVYHNPDNLARWEKVAMETVRNF